MIAGGDDPEQHPHEVDGALGVAQGPEQVVPHLAGAETNQAVGERGRFAVDEQHRGARQAAEHGALRVGQGDLHEILAAEQGRVVEQAGDGERLTGEVELVADRQAEILVDGRLARRNRRMTSPGGQLPEAAGDGPCDVHVLHRAVPINRLMDEHHRLGPPHTRQPADGPDERGIERAERRQRPIGPLLHDPEVGTDSGDEATGLAAECR